LNPFLNGSHIVLILTVSILLVILEASDRKIALHIHASRFTLDVSRSRLQGLPQLRTKI
jgi:hypothetical protein